MPFKHNGPFKQVWNFIILLTVLIFSFLITYRLAFQIFEPDSLYYFLNFLFFLDLGVNFVTRVKEGHLKLDTFPEIRKHYLKTWFTVDFLSFFPFELIPVAIYGGIPTDPLGFNIYLGLQAFTLIKLVKAVRLIREIQEAWGLSPGVTRLISFGYWFSQGAHLMALGWVLIGAVETSRLFFDQYLRALYWVITTVATIGYGDYYPNHESNSQIIYTIIIQLFGVGMYSYIIGNVANLISSLDVARSGFQRHLEEVNAYLKSVKAPPKLQERVRDYYSYLWEQKRSHRTTNILQDLPHSLHVEILLFQNKGLLEKVSVFKGADEFFIREAVEALIPGVFLPGEAIMNQGEYGDCMYFLTEGELEVLVNGSPVARLGPGSVFGEGALLTEEHRNASVVSLTYGTGYRLLRSDFQVLRERYPSFDQRVKEILQSRGSPKALDKQSPDGI